MSDARPRNRRSESGGCSRALRGGTSLCRNSARLVRFFLVAPFMKHDDLDNLLKPVIGALGLELLGLEFAPHRTNALLRIYIDAPGRTVTIEDCEAVSREVSATLDVNDPIKSHYTLEVSSPGIDRPLFAPEHFARIVGHEAKVQVNVPIDGRRRFQGPVRAVEGTRITLEQDGNAVAIEHGNIQKANLIGEIAGRQPKKGTRHGR
ncbi:MAG TPA: ribosome maturation factor RimP [Candidatus Saccharimonadia bacterium]|nr:ribosome maturation factor RimP [Candidatus Saccharimonadia bacterium]